MPDPRLTQDVTLPVPDEQFVRRQIGWLAALMLLLGAWYFTWLLHPIRIGEPALFWILVAAEAFNGAQAFGFALTCARQRVRPASPHPQAEALTVDVLVPRYNEPPDVVEPTLAAAVRMGGPQVRVWLLDDGRSPEMADLAWHHGTGYLVRADRSGAKAGNLNAALRRTDAPFVAVLDCDHVPDERFLEATLGHLQDERVAFVQTPQCYANATVSAVSAAAWAQQALFFGAIARGKDARGAIFCCGTNVVFRRAALEEVGGFPERSLTEDFELSIRLHERGWLSRYVPEVLARGLGPEDMASYVSQQQRWARGCLSALPRVLRARMPAPVKLQYVLSSSYFLFGCTLAIYMTLPIVRLLAGIQPLAATSADEFVLHFAPWFCVALAMVAASGAGTYTFGAFALTGASFWIHVSAALRALLHRPARFVVTPKHGESIPQPRAVAPALAMLAALVGAIVYGLSRDPGPATLNNVAFAALHVGVLGCGVLPALRPGAAAPRRAAPTPLAEPSGLTPRPARRFAWQILIVAAVVVGAVAAASRDSLAPAPSLPARARESAEGFFHRYVTVEGRAVRADQGGDTVSEGQSYALLLAVALDDHTRFRRVWRWTRVHLQRPDGLLAYRWSGGRLSDSQPAADADLDAARALALASIQFGSRAYAREAARIARAIRRQETATVGSRAVLLAGPWARIHPRVINPSYFSPRAFEELYRVDRSPTWAELIGSSRQLIRSLVSRPPHLPPDWARVAARGGRPWPSARADTVDPQYGLDAVRVPIRMAESCASADRRLAAAIWPFLRSLRSRSIASVYSLDGQPRGPSHPAALVAAAASAGAAGNRSARDRLLDEAAALDLKHPTYYGAAWVALGRIQLTTNAFGRCRR